MIILVSVSEHRITFSRGNFVQYRGTDIGRLENIFVQEVLQDQQRLFVVVTPCIKHPTQKMDPTLNLPLLKLSKETIIVGLVALSARKLYILPLENEDFLFVDWQIQFL